MHVKQSGKPSTTVLQWLADEVKIWEPKAVELLVNKWEFPVHPPYVRTVANRGSSFAVPMDAIPRTNKSVLCRDMQFWIVFALTAPSSCKWLLRTGGCQEPRDDGEWKHLTVLRDWVVVPKWWNWKLSISTSYQVAIFYLSRLICASPNNCHQRRHRCNPHKFWESKDQRSINLHQSLPFPWWRLLLHYHRPRLKLPSHQIQVGLLMY